MISQEEQSMRSVFGLLAGCGIVMLVACSRTEPPGAAGPVEATISAAEVDTRLPGEESHHEAARGEPVMEGNTGLAVGQKAPSFLLEDQAGTERSLDEFLKKGKVALVFYRSADW
jgi:hypothetical protein